MGDFLNMVALVAAGVALSIGLGIYFGAAFLTSRWAMAIKTHPQSTRWVCLFICGLLWFLFLKFIRPIYWGWIAAVSVALIGISLLSWIEKRILWKEIFTLSFWFSENTPKTLAKDGM